MVRLITFVILQIYVTEGFFPNTPEMVTIPPDDGDPGEPLFLTPYIESGKIEEGRRLARVNLPGVPHTESYSGLLTVNTTYNSNLFFWYFPAIYKDLIPKPTPSLLVYLQGYPGVSALYGQFEQNGHIEVVKINNVTEFKKREWSWNMINNVIYIDHAAGAGFSFTNDPRGCSTDMNQVGDQLYSALFQVYQLFPELQPNSMFLTGELYAGKFATALARTIHHRNPAAKIKLELRGLIIASPWCDPMNQLRNAKYFYHVGVFDAKKAAYYEEHEIIMIGMVKQERWLAAYEYFENMMKYLEFYSLLKTIHNFLEDLIFGVPNFVSLVQTSPIRRSLHVGNLKFHDGESARDALKSDFMKSVAPWLSELLQYYEIFFINGALGGIVPSSSMTNFMVKLDPLLVNAQISRVFTRLPPHNRLKFAGLLSTGCNHKLGKKSGNLTGYWIPSVGNLPSRDQPILTAITVSTFSYVL